MVAPLVGAWIEISKMGAAKSTVSSLLSWERGLKYNSVLKTLSARMVAPLVGAWIEIKVFGLLYSALLVAPLVGAWIEIFLNTLITSRHYRRSSRGSVD